MRRSGLKALHLVASGEVQQVGYRRLVWRLARRLGVKGYVENMPDGRVRIVAEEEEAVLAKFRDAIQVKDAMIIVEAVEAVAKRPTGRFKDFQIRLGSLKEELVDGLGAGEAQLGLLRQEFGAYQTEFRDYRTEFRDYRSEFRDYRTEFRDYRSEFRDFAERTDSNLKSLDARYGEISEKLTQVLETLQKESMETRRVLAQAMNALTEAVTLLKQSVKGQA